MNERTNVLCQCGWGELAIPEEKIPDYCPVCDYPFWETKESTGNRIGE